jgi:hypothetical protein
MILAHNLEISHILYRSPKYNITDITNHKQEPINYIKTDIHKITDKLRYFIHGII